MRAAIHVVFGFLVSLLAACSPHVGTRAERAASFAPYERTKIGDQTAWDYLLARSAWVTAGEGLKARISTGTESNVTLRVRSSLLQFGTAAAIDRRGYFLTAAHNLHGAVCYVAFYKNGVRLLPGRVVWQGKEKQGGADLGLVHVDESLTSAFSWAPAPRPGDPALAAGLNSGRRFRFQLVGFAGSVLRVSRPLHADDRHTIIMHQAPLRPGDSGGPLVTPDGRLLGINTEIYPFDLLRLPRIAQSSAAQRPDPEFIQRLIEQDVAARRKAR